MTNATYMEGKRSFVIEMPRGDLQWVSFDVTDAETKEHSDITITEIFFTVKKEWTSSSYLFQKKLSTGQIELTENNSYRFAIEPEDTDRLTFGDYACDIELVGPAIKSTTVGRLVLTHEATYAGNE